MLYYTLILCMYIHVWVCGGVYARVCVCVSMRVAAGYLIIVWLLPLGEEAALDKPWVTEGPSLGP